MPGWCSGRSETIRRSGLAAACDDLAAGGRGHGAGRGTFGVARRGSAAAGRERQPQALAVEGERARRVADPEDAIDLVRLRIDPRHRAAGCVGDPHGAAGDRDAAGAGADLDRARRAALDPPQQAVLRSGDPDRAGADREPVEVGGGDRHARLAAKRRRHAHDLEPLGRLGQRPCAVAVRDDAGGGEALDRGRGAAVRIDPEEAVVGAEHPQPGIAERDPVEGEPRRVIALRQRDLACDGRVVGREPHYAPRHQQAEALRAGERPDAAGAGGDADRCRRRRERARR